MYARYFVCDCNGGTNIAIRRGHIVQGSLWYGPRYSAVRASDGKVRGPGGGGGGSSQPCCCWCFETWAISFTPLCLRLSGEALEAVGPFYLVSMLREVNYLTQCVTCGARYLSITRVTTEASMMRISVNKLFCSCQNSINIIVEPKQPTSVESV